MWLALIRIYWDICLFKKSPADSPYSPLLPLFSSIFFLLIVILQWIITSQKIQVDYTDIILIGCMLLVSYVVYTGLLLSIYHQLARLTQTLTCLFVCHAIVHVMGLPLLLAVPYLKALNSSSMIAFCLNMIFLVASLMLSVWQFMITAHIYKFALSLKTPASLLASLGLLAVNILMVSFW